MALRRTDCIALVLFLLPLTPLACGTSAQTSIGPGHFTGGAPGTMCTVATNKQACWHDPAFSPALPTAVFCDPSTATWALMKACEPNQFCVETAVAGQSGLAATCEDKYDADAYVAVTPTDAGATDAGGDGSGDGSTASGDGSGADAGPLDVAPTPKTWSWVAIYDDTKTCAGTGPGADIDAVALYRKGKLLGVGRPGSVQYVPPPLESCKLNGHNKEFDQAACAGPLGDIDPVELAHGYLSLGGGWMAMQIGACAGAGKSLHDCDGLGEAIILQSGDEIDVYEVDTWYLNTKNPKTGKPYITAQCKCDPEPYTVYVRKSATSGDQVEVGSHTGTAIQKLVVPDLPAP